MWGRITGQLVRRLAPSLRLSSPREAQHQQWRLSWEPPPPPQLPCPAASSRYHPGRTWSTPWDCQHSAVSTLSSPDGQLQRRHVLVVDLVDVCSPLQQDLDNLLSATADSIVERCGVPGTNQPQFPQIYRPRARVTSGSISGWRPLRGWAWWGPPPHYRPWQRHWGWQTC